MLFRSRGSRLCLFDGQPEKMQTPVYDWDRLEPGHRITGPALIDAPGTTVWVGPQHTVRVDNFGNLRMELAA